MDSVVMSRLPDRIVSVAIRQNLQPTAARVAAGLMINVELPPCLRPRDPARSSIRPAGERAMREAKIESWLLEMLTVASALPRSRTTTPESDELSPIAPRPSSRPSIFERAVRSFFWLRS